MGLYIGIGQTMAQAGEWVVMNDLFSPVLADSTEEVTSLFTLAPPWVTVINDEQVIEFTDVSYEDSTNTLVYDLLETLWTPEIGASVSAIDFGDVLLDQTVEIEFYLDNIRTGVLEVLNLRVAGDPYELNFTPGDIYAVDDSMVVTISFTPTSTGAFTDTILVQTDVGELSIPVTGSGYEETAVDPLVRNTPIGYGLQRIYPNPFNSSTSITFAIEHSGEIQLDVFNLHGKKVGALISGYVEKGVHSVAFNAHNMTSGIYYVRLQAGGTEFVNKLIYIK